MSQTTVDATETKSDTKTSLVRDVYHCTLKHLTNARVHLQEAWTDVELEIRSYIENAWKYVNKWIKEIYFYYAEGKEPDFWDEIISIRRALMNLMETEASKMSETAWMELSFAVGHLENATEHRMEK